MRAAHLAPILLVLLWGGAVGCDDGGGGLGGDGGPGPGPSCTSDEDCEEEIDNRACLRGRCGNPCPTGMAYVSAGEFTQGCDQKENTAMAPKNCLADAQPEHQVQLSRPFCISKNELSVGEYRACVGAGKCQASADLICTPQSAMWTAAPGNNERRPLNCLLWTEAKQACEAQGARLPTEAEWEKAARGSDRRRFPWGNGNPNECGKGVNWGGGADCTGLPWDVGSGKGTNALSSCGAYDMGGNLWEWVADWYADRAYDACGASCTDPTGPADGILRVRRGGSYQSVDPGELRGAFREFHLPGAARSDMNGVRCARSL